MVSCMEFSNATAIVYSTHTPIARVWPVLKVFLSLFTSFCFFFLVLFSAWKRIILITASAMRSILSIDDTKRLGARAK